MKNTRRLLSVLQTLLLLSCAAFVSGCVESGIQSDNENVSQKTNEGGVATRAVVVGMETSARYGSCPGAGYDAKRMSKVLKQYTSDVQMFLSGEANYNSVRAAMERGVKESELFIFYYSGHGGSQKFSDTGGEETDGMDEFLCLNDTYMRDNEIWSIISKTNGRVMLIFDCCHSQTLYSLPHPLSVADEMSARDVHAIESNVRVMCWSGCPDDTYSYGSSSGGKFTNAFLKYFDKNMTYDELWNLVESDSALKACEDVQRTDIGESFGSNVIFR